MEANASLVGKLEIPIDDSLNQGWSGSMWLKGEAKKKFTKNVVAPIYGIPVPLTGTVELSGGLSGNVRAHGTLLYPWFTGTINPSVGVSVFGGVGADAGDNVLKAGVYGSGSGNLTFNYSGGWEFDPSLNLSVGCKISAKVFNAINVNPSYELAAARLDKSGWHGTAFGGSVQLFEEDNSPALWAAMDREHLNSSSGFVGGGYVSLEETETDGKDKTLIYLNTSSAAEAKLCETDGNTYIFFTADDASRESQNSLKLMYSKLNTDGGWEEPKAVEDDGTLDTSVRTSGRYVIWENTASVLPDGITEIGPVLAETEISAARLNEDGSISVYGLTNDSVYDSAPDIKETSYGAIAMWVSNSDSDILRKSGVNSLHYSKFDGSSWGEVQTVENVGSVGSTYLAIQDDKGYIFYNSDGAVHVYSIDDGTNSIVGVGIARYTVNTVGGKTALAYFDESQNLYYDGDVLEGFNPEKIEIDCYNVNTAENPGIAADGNEVYIIWQGRSNGNNALCGVRAENGEWSEDIRFITAKNDVRGASPLVNGGRLRLCYFTEDNIVDENGAVSTENCNLYFCDIVPSHNLSITEGSVVYDDEEYAESGTVALSFTVENIGELPVESYTVSVSDNSGILYTAASDDLLKAGAECGEVISFDLAKSSVSRNLKLTVTPDGVTDFDPSDNSVAFSVGMSHIDIYDSYISFENSSAYLNVLLKNRGSSASDEIKLILSDENETAELYSGAIEALNGDETCFTRIDISSIAKKHDLVRLNVYSNGGDLLATELASIEEAGKIDIVTELAPLKGFDFLTIKKTENSSGITVTLISGENDEVLNGIKMYCAEY
ncbi:MAG: hypothetical protein ACI4SS_02625, partial [Clostridia bacterium]